VAAKKDEVYHSKCLQFCKEYVDSHSKYLEKEVRNLGAVMGMLAECYCLKQDFDTCDALFEKWLGQEPDWS